MLRSEIELFTKLSGEDGMHTSIGRIGGYLDGYNKALENQKWIPPTKKLPEVGQIVLICTASKSVNEATYKGLNSQEESVWLSHGNVLWDDDVVRWMPLPEPYKGEQT